MATATTGYTWASGNTVLPGLLNQMVNSATITLSNDEVTTAKILDANVTTAKIADANVTAAKLATSAVETAKIADDAVTNDKLSLAANAGEIKKAINADNSPPIYACRAWVNFDGTKDTTGAASTSNTNRLIRGSGNVTSVLRNGAGDYTITFTTAMPDANYAIALVRDEGSSTVARGSSGVTVGNNTTPAAGSFNINCRVGSTSGTDGLPDDPPTVTASIFR
jgi:hypothetical protein